MAERSGGQAAVVLKQWDRSTFLGRVRYYAFITDPRSVVLPKARFLEAKTLMELYKDGRLPINTTQTQLDKAQKLYLSAFHPDSGELQNTVGRMSFQVPGGTLLIAAMLIFYKSTAAVIFWQWANQSFNALVNYTNRNAKSHITPQQIGVAYVSATSSALITAVGMKHFFAKRHLPTLAQRLVPLIAVAAANCVNIPLMRQNELKDGIMLHDDDDEDVCKSKLAAVKAVSLVTVSRIMIAGPTMLITPVVMENLEKAFWFRRSRKLLNVPVQVALSAACLALLIPIGCSLFPQRNWVYAEQLKKYESKAYKAAVHIYDGEEEKIPEKLFFNKGL